MGKESKDGVQSKNVLEFITVANEVCIFFEEIDKYEPEFMFAYLQKVLPLLYLKGALMNDVHVDNEDANERFVTLEQWENIHRDLLKKAGVRDNFHYIESCAADDFTEEKGSIAENLADIYQDLKDFILLYQKNTLTAQENAVHACKVLFEINWGMKALSAHTAIHSLLYGRKKVKKNSLGFSPN